MWLIIWLALVLYDFVVFENMLEINIFSQIFSS